MLSNDAEVLRDHLGEQVTRIAVGQSAGLLKPSALLRILDAMDQEPVAQSAGKYRQRAAALSREELDARIAELQR
jgi:hypothetical protein